MRFGYYTLLFGFLSVSAIARQPAPAHASPQSEVKQAAAKTYGKLPLGFAPNRGQAAPSVSFVAQGPGYGIELQPGSVTFALRRRTGSPGKLADGKTDVVRMNIVGGNAKAKFTAAQPLPGYVNYMHGSTSSKWQIAVPTFAETRVHDVYPGTDLAYHGNGSELEYDFIVHPGASPASIGLAIDGAKASLTAGGSLALRLAGEAKATPLEFGKPVVYQQVNGKRKQVSGAFEISRDGNIGFTVGKYDHKRDLVIDPSIVYASYYSIAPQPYNNDIYAAAINAADDLYIVGDTDGALINDNPQLGPTNGSPNAFVAKISATGSEVLWTTILGGSSNQQALAVAISSADQAYVTGVTGSQNGDGLSGGNLPGQMGASNSFPITSDAIQPLCGPVGYDGGDYQIADYAEVSGCASGQPDAFISRLSSDGKTLIYSTFLGGSQNETGTGIALDSSNNIYVAGITNSDQYAPTYTNTSTGAAQCTIPAYMVATNGAGNGDYGYADFPTTANAYNQSYTLSKQYYVANVNQPQTANCAYSVGSTDIPFLTELSADGHTFLYSTTYGGLNLGGCLLSHRRESRLLVERRTLPAFRPSARSSVLPAWQTHQGSVAKAHTLQPSTSISPASTHWSSAPTWSAPSRRRRPIFRPWLRTVQETSMSPATRMPRIFRPRRVFSNRTRAASWTAMVIALRPLSPSSAARDRQSGLPITKKRLPARVERQTPQPSASMPAITSMCPDFRATIPLRTVPWLRTADATIS